MPKSEEHDGYCWAHHVIEAPGYFRCGECLHWFPSEERLVFDYNFKVAQDDVWAAGVRTADEIFFCPHCAHDF